MDLEGFPILKNKWFRYHLVLILLVCFPLFCVGIHVMSWTFVGSEQVFPRNSSIFNEVSVSLKTEQAFSGRSQWKAVRTSKRQFSPAILPGNFLVLM